LQAINNRAKKGEFVLPKKLLIEGKYYLARVGTLLFIVNLLLISLLFIANFIVIFFGMYDFGNF